MIIGIILFPAHFCSHLGQCPVLKGPLDGKTGIAGAISFPDIEIKVARCNNLVNNRMILKEKFSGIKAYVKTSINSLSTNQLDKKLMEQVVRAIEEHIDETDFNVDSLVQTIGMSRSKLFSKLNISEISDRLDARF